MSSSIEYLAEAARTLRHVMENRQLEKIGPMSQALCALALVEIAQELGNVTDILANMDQRTQATEVLK